MKLKVSDLKKQLKEYDQKELIKLMADLFKNSKEAQAFLSARLLGEEAINELYTQAKNKISNGFFPQKGSLRLSEAQKAISEFKKLSDDTFKTADLMLYYVEQGVEFTDDFGYVDDTIFSSIIKMYEKVTIICNKEEEYYHSFADRLKKVVSDTTDMNWDFHDELTYLYYDMGYSEEDEE